MKKYFYFGSIGLILFEVANVYFIMPMPGSQEMNSIDLAFFLYSWRWVFRIVFLTMIIIGISALTKAKRKWPAVLLIFVTGTVYYTMNFVMSADKMFLQPENIVLKSSGDNKIEGHRLVIGLEKNGEAKAYPVEFLAYHHQILDSIGGFPVIVTYCSVCRTARVYEPIVRGVYEEFRLVGMDHFNAMFEDKTTGSWWRQATGEAITGTLKGERLPELASLQMTVDKWFELYPNGKVMQVDQAFEDVYDPHAKFERGESQNELTGTDSLSWKKKSWVVGIQVKNSSKAYDWNQLKKEQIIHDKVNGTPLVLVLSRDGQSFAAFERRENQFFTIDDSTDFLHAGVDVYNFTGQPVNSNGSALKKINAYQEFWHSWLTFHPNTEK